MRWRRFPTADGARCVPRGGPLPGSVAALRGQAAEWALGMVHGAGIGPTPLAGGLREID